MSSDRQTSCDCWFSGAILLTFSRFIAFLLLFIQDFLLKPLLVVLLLVFKVLAHLLLSFVVQTFDLVDLVHIENVIIANLLQKLEQQRSLGLCSPLRHFLVKILVQVGLLHDLSNDVCATDIHVVGLGELGVLDSLLSEREFKHLYPLD